MYRLSYLPSAKNDIENIINYIAKALSAPKAALDLLNSLDTSISRLSRFPYSCRVYQPFKPLTREHRILIVNSYAVFYTINEQEKLVEICRVVYSKNNLEERI